MLRKKRIAYLLFFAAYIGALVVESRLFSFDEPPMVITFIDQDEKVKKVLTAFRKKVKSGFIVTSIVEVWK